MEIERIRTKNPTAKIIAYFQAHTNTYCSLSKLKEITSEALSVEDVWGISIATRPDCLDDEKISYLKELSQRTNLTLELGLQTVHDEVAKKFNRGYDYELFQEIFLKLKSNEIRTCVHLINGLPGENQEMMIETARVVGALKPDSMKIHLLHVIKNTELAKDFLQEKYTPMTFLEYVDTVIKQLEVLPPETVIERITGDADKNKLLAPMWSKDKIKVLGTIDKTMANNLTFQGIKFTCKKEEN